MDPLRGRLGPPARSGDIGATTDQIGGELGGYAHRFELRSAGSIYRQSPIRAGAEQRSQAVAGQRNLLVDRAEISPRLQGVRLGEPLFAQGVEAVCNTVANELAGLILDADSAFGDIALGKKAGQVG